MSKQNDLPDTHIFDLIDSKLEIPLDDIARHVEAYQGVTLEEDYTPEIEDKVSLKKLHEEMPYDKGDINADLEYLVVEDFLDKEIVSKGNVVYSLTDKAQDYYSEIKEWTPEYSESIESALEN